MKKQKGEKSKLYLILVLLCLAVIIFVLVYYLNTQASRVLDEKEIPTSLTIGNRTGFNVSKDALSFGLLAPGVAASRDDLILTNGYSFPIKLEFAVEGSIEPLLIYEKIIYLEPGESRNVSVSTIVITDEVAGDYAGKFIIVFRKAG